MIKELAEREFVYDGRDLKSNRVSFYICEHFEIEDKDLIISPTSTWCMALDGAIRRNNVYTSISNKTNPCWSLCSDRYWRFSSTKFIFLFVETEFKEKKLTFISSSMDSNCCYQLQYPVNKAEPKQQPKKRPNSHNKIHSIKWTGIQ